MTYLHHIALNLGVALSALWWAVIPPQWHHTPEQCADLVHGSAFAWFAWGLGLREKPAPKPNAPECPGRVSREQG